MRSKRSLQSLYQFWTNTTSCRVKQTPSEYLKKTVGTIAAFRNFDRFLALGSTADALGLAQGKGLDCKRWTFASTGRGKQACIGYPEVRMIVAATKMIRHRGGAVEAHTRSAKNMRRREFIPRTELLDDRFGACTVQQFPRIARHVLQ